MAGRTGRRSRVVNANLPAVAIEVEPVLVGLPQDAVLGFLIDFDLGMIGAEMAFSAGLRFARLGLGKAMPRMAGAAASPTVVRVDSTDPRIGPRRRVELAAGQHLDGRAMALEAAARDRRRTTDHLA